MQLALIKRNAALAEVFNKDDRDIEILKKQKLGENAPEVVFTPAEGGNTAAIVTIGPDHPQYRIVMSAIAEMFYRTSYVLPAQELAIEFEKQREYSKMGSTKKPQPGQGRPSTKQGLPVTLDLLASLRDKEAMKQQGLQKKRDNEKVAEEKKLQQRENDKAVGEELLGIHFSGADTWEQFSSDKVKGAYRYLTKTELKDIVTASNSLKKADVVLAIREYLLANCPRPALVDHEMGQDLAPEAQREDINLEQAMDIDLGQAMDAELHHADLNEAMQLDTPQQEHPEVCPVEQLLGEPSRPRRGTKRPRKLED